MSPVSFLQQLPLDALQPRFLKEHILIQLDDQLNIQMKICFGGADGAGGMDVDVVSMFDEVVVDIVEEQGMSRIVVIGGHVQAFGGGDDCAIR